MRRGLWLLVLGVLAAALGVASARAAGPGTTTTGTTTSTTTAPAYVSLSLFSLPAGCVGAGAAALLPPSHPPIALGTPSASLGPSAYPASGSVLAFDSSTQSGWGCRSAKVALSSVSLFGGAVTASSVQATNGNGSVAGLAIDGSAVTVEAGQTVPVSDWGRLTLGATVGRVKAPLVLRLLRAHDSLPAGTAVAVAFAAAPLPARPTHRNQTGAQEQTIGPTGSAQQGGKGRQAQPRKPPPDYPALPYRVVVDGHLAAAARHNPVVATAMRYLGVKYTWGGASPKTGFDCSGLVQYVFGQLGVSLPHYAASQWHTPYGVYVAPNRLQPGDLVFFVGSDGTRKEPGHVGIYVGDGYLIDAPHTGTFVRIDSLKERGFANGFVGARRIVGPLHDARHLFDETKPGALAAGLPLGFLPQVTVEPLGASLGPAAAGRSGYWMWAGGGGGGGLLLLLASAGLVLRRRRTGSAAPGTAY